MIGVVGPRALEARRDAGEARVGHGRVGEPGGRQVMAGHSGVRRVLGAGYVAGRKPVLGRSLLLGRIARAARRMRRERAPVAGALAVRRVPAVVVGIIARIGEGTVVAVSVGEL